MIRLREFVIVLLSAVFVVVLSACGGGSSDSGSGTVNANKNAPGTSGTYPGTGVVQAAGPGGAEDFSFNAVLTIAENGQVQFNILGGTGDCALDDNVYLIGNEFTYEVTANCALGDLGVCDISETATGIVKDGEARLDTQGQVSCSLGVANYTGTWSGTEAKASSMSAYGQTEQDARIIDSLKRTLGM